MFDNNKQNEYSTNLTNHFISTNSYSKNIYLTESIKIYLNANKPTSALETTTLPQENISGADKSFPSEGQCCDAYQNSSDPDPT